MTKAQGPEYAVLSSVSKRLVQKLGGTADHCIEVETGTPGQGWSALDDLGWVRLHVHNYGGYTVTFTLSGWEWWCRQCDAVDGLPLTPLEFD